MVTNSSTLLFPCHDTPFSHPKCLPCVPNLSLYHLEFWVVVTVLHLVLGQCEFMLIIGLAGASEVSDTLEVCLTATLYIGAELVHIIKDPFLLVLEQLCQKDMHWFLCWCCGLIRQHAPSSPIQPEMLPGICFGIRNVGYEFLKYVK